MKKLLKVLILSVALMSSSTCVTVSLEKKDSQKAEDVKFAPPPPPFEEFPAPFVDKAWRFSEDSCSISFHSDCKERSTLKLQQIYEQIISDLDESQVLMSRYEVFKNLRALRSKVRGRLEGIPTQMEFVIFRKKDCVYVLNYISLDPLFDKNYFYFINFLQSFYVP